MRILWVLIVFCLIGNGLWGQEEKKKEKIELSVGSEYGYTRPISKEPHSYFFHYLHNVGIIIRGDLFRYFSLKTGLRYHKYYANVRDLTINPGFWHNKATELDVSEFFLQTGSAFISPLIFKKLIFNIEYTHFFQIWNRNVFKKNKYGEDGLNTFGWKKQMDEFAIGLNYKCNDFIYLGLKGIYGLGTGIDIPGARAVYFTPLINFQYKFYSL